MYHKQWRSWNHKRIIDKITKELDPYRYINEKGGAVSLRILYLETKKQNGISNLVINENIYGRKQSTSMWFIDSILH